MENNRTVTGIFTVIFSIGVLTGLIGYIITGDWTALLVLGVLILALAIIECIFFPFVFFGWILSKMFGKKEKIPNKESEE